MDGQSHQVYQLKYPRGETWSLRISKSEWAASLAKAGTAILQHLKKVQPTLQVPRPIYESEEYCLLQFLEGDTLGAWDSVKRTKVGACYSTTIGTCHGRARLH
jgi:aminoglycoside phosphotransferase (APT) family kinase protein